MGERNPTELYNKLLICLKPDIEMMGERNENPIELSNKLQKLIYLALAIIYSKNWFVNNLSKHSSD